MQYVNFTPVTTTTVDSPSKRVVKFRLKVEMRCRNCGEQTTVSTEPSTVGRDRKQFPASSYITTALSAIKSSRTCESCDDISGFKRDFKRLEVDVRKVVTDEWLNDRCDFEPLVGPNADTDPDAGLSDEGKDDLLATARKRVPVNSLWRHRRKSGVTLRILSIALEDGTNQVQVVYAPADDLKRATAQSYCDFKKRIESDSTQKPQYVRVDNRAPKEVAKQARPTDEERFQAKQVRQDTARQEARRKKAAKKAAPAKVSLRSGRKRSSGGSRQS